MSAPDRSISRETVMAAFADVNRLIEQRERHAQPAVQNGAETAQS